jgi:adenylate kinase
MEIIIITGAPYSGKGTQCDLLEKSLGFSHISTGDKIREEKERRTPLGKIMTTYEEQGALVPNEIMKDVIQKIIEENLNKKGIILDGYPRTISQVDTLFGLIDGKNVKVKRVINIEIAKEGIRRIQAKRRVQAGKMIRMLHIHVSVLKYLKKKQDPP